MQRIKSMGNRISREFLFKKVLLGNHAVGLTLKGGEKIVVVDLFSSEKNGKKLPQIIQFRMIVMEILVCMCLILAQVGRCFAG